LTFGGFLRRLDLLQPTGTHLGRARNGGHGLVDGDCGLVDLFAPAFDGFYVPVNIGLGSVERRQGLV
jgi:hypothetical protein